MRCNFTVDGKSRRESAEVTARGQSSNFLARLVTNGRTTIFDGVLCVAYR